MGCLYLFISTKWRSYRDRRFCGVLSPYVVVSSARRRTSLGAELSAGCMCRGGIDQVVELSTVTEAFTLTTRSISPACRHADLIDHETFRIPPPVLKRTILIVDVKTFLRDLFWSRFHVFYVLFIFRTFLLFLKTLPKFRAASRLTRSTFKITATKKPMIFLLRVE